MAIKKEETKTEEKVSEAKVEVKAEEVPELDLTVTPTTSEAKKNFIKILEAYKKQNPKKFELKKKELGKKLALL